jgi:hypothetical protein
VPSLAGAGAQVQPRPRAGGADPFAIDPACGRANIRDTDHDGLHRRLREAVRHRRQRRATADNDGLSDAYETATSHTDPLSADTDKDGLTDA